jgi:hypothetical protein
LYHATNLSSGNFHLFPNALADALAEQDIASIEPHTDTLYFVVDCGQASTCDTGWYDLEAQLMAGTLRIDLPHNASLNPPTSSPCPDAANDTQLTWVVGSFDNMTDLPLGHFGTAMLGFEACCGGSGVVWGWGALYLC